MPTLQDLIDPGSKLWILKNRTIDFSDFCENDLEIVFGEQKK